MPGFAPGMLPFTSKKAEAGATGRETSTRHSDEPA
jgi:hypothetical protein